METWLICGGRDFADQDLFDNTMIALFKARGLPGRIVHGGAKGADTKAGHLARMMSIPCVAVMPDWSLGKIAGPRRNQKMLDEYEPTLVVAFPGGRGTADMVSRARKAGVRIVEASGCLPSNGQSPE